jgi:hypothetical protein
MLQHMVDTIRVAGVEESLTTLSLLNPLYEHT